MSRLPDKRMDLVAQWIDKAEHDYSAALYLLESSETDVPYDVVCFHAQQCAEKYLKATGVHERMSVPRTHDLMELLSLLPSGIRPTMPAEELAELNPYGIDIRYPGFFESVTRDDATRALSIANRIRVPCRTFLLKGMA
jgi:HEPN domain-containing protein